MTAVQIVCVARCQNPTPKIAEQWMLNDELDQRVSNTSASVICAHKNIAKPRKGCKIAHHPCIGDLLGMMKRPEHQSRIAGCAFHFFAGDAF